MLPLDCITELNLRMLAGERWFARGETYQSQARVADLVVSHNSISASVSGTHVYYVQLSCLNTRLTFNCTCPVGEDGNFCKHCVAVGLAWLSQPNDKRLASKSSLQTYLENMDHQQLVELVLSAASNNRRLRDKLEFAEAASAGLGNAKTGRRSESTPESNKEWEHWRTEALRFLRERVGPSPAKQTLDRGIPVSNPWHSSRDRSVLVEIFLWEGNSEEAWEEAMAGGGSANLWLQLADHIAPQHPARAYLVYQELIVPTVEQTNSAAYSEAIKLLKKMHKLSSTLSCEPDFFDYVTSLRVEYKRKRNFIQKLDTYVTAFR